MPQRLLLTGGEGFVAREIADRLAAEFEIVSVGRARCDVTDYGQVERTIGDERPDVVVHLAAWVDKTKCERFPLAARVLNVEGARNVARACAWAGAALVYVSSDFVFGGEKRTPYSENDVPAPLNVYGATKYEGERATLELCPEATIIRTSRLFGRYGRSFISILPGLMRAEKRIKVVDDVVSGITYVRDFIDAAAVLMRERRPGLHHVVNGGECTVFRFAESVREKMNADVELEPISWAVVSPEVKAPSYCVLASGKSNETAAVSLRGWELALAEFLEAGGYV